MRNRRELRLSLLVDRVARWFIRTGGAVIIAAVMLVFVVLLVESAPIFLRPQLRPVAGFQNVLLVPPPDLDPAACVTDPYGGYLTCVTRNGHAVTVDLKQKTTVATEPVLSVTRTGTLKAATHDRWANTLVLLTSRGDLYSLRLNWQWRYTRNRLRRLAGIRWELKHWVRIEADPDSVKQIAYLPEETQAHEGWIAVLFPFRILRSDAKWRRRSSVKRNR